MFLIKVMVFVLFFYLYSTSEILNPPHIILIVADDLGWNDVSFHGASDIPTPNIDALALNGIILNNYYGEWLCTPSRGALLSGMYPIRLGLQHHVIVAGEASALPLNLTILPQYLKKFGYETHMIGKWHLGYQNKVYMPTYRGFDTFFGYLNGFVDYFDYTHNDATLLPKQPMYFGIDLHNGTELIRNFRGKYATQVFENHAKDIIMNHDTSKNLFLYLPHLAVHTGNTNQPLQAPPEIISKFRHIKDVKRRIHAAKTSALDDAVGTVFKALSQRNMLKDSIVIFISDNGGQNNPKLNGYSSNYPLRGNKYTAWEGGVRIPAVVWSPRLHLQKPLVSKQLMHVTDWLPTLYHAAGGNVSDLGHIDGINMWKTLTQNVPSPRKHLLNVLDPILEVFAFRNEDFKIVNGTTKRDNLWYGPTSSENIGKPPSLYNWIFRTGSVVKDVLTKEGWWVAEDPDSVYDAAIVTCEQPIPRAAGDCNPLKEPCLFNIKEDPCEYYNLAKENPKIVESMLAMVRAYSKEQMAPQFKDVDPRADPMCHNFAYVPFLDPEHRTECDYAY